MGFLTRCKRLFSFAFLLQNRNTFFSFFLKSFLILSEKQQRGFVAGTFLYASRYISKMETVKMRLAKESRKLKQ